MLTFDTGMKLLAAKSHAQVYERSIAALKKNEKDPLAFFFLGVIAAQHGHREKALECFAKATEHSPQNACYQAYHAKALLDGGQREAATQRANTASALQNNDAFVADMIGVVYSRTGAHERALPHFKRAIDLKPRWAKFHFNLGASAQFIGDFDEARTAYTRAVALDPHLYPAWFALVSLEKQSPDNTALETLKSLFPKAAGDAEGQLLIGHSIAKILEDLGQYKESFAWLTKAKAATKQKMPYDKHAKAKVFAAVKTLRVDTATPQSPTAAVPIFILGLPRTGTTLLDRILSSHTDVVSAGELNLFAQLVQKQAAVQAKLTSDADVYTAMRASGLTAVHKIYDGHIQNLANAHRYVIDKTPLNFFYAGLIHKAFPNARIIALRRGAMDSCLSNYRQIFSSHTNAYNYNLDIKDTATFYREFDALMMHWRETLPKNRFMEIHYENIVTDQENQTRRLLDFCDLGWEEACLHFYENSAPVDTASSVQVRKPLYSGAIGRWKHYGETLSPLKAGLGSLALEDEKRKQ